MKKSLNTMQWLTNKNSYNSYQIVNENDEILVELSKNKVTYTPGSAPPGYVSSNTNAYHQIISDDSNNNRGMKQSQEDVDQLLTRRSWDMALAPAKQLPMNMLFLWMTGDSISFIPIMMIGMVFYQCIQSFFQIPATFKAISEGLANAWPQKIIYVLSKIALFIFTLYKFNSMGLLPIYMSDWLAFAVKQESLEMSFL